MARTIPQLTSDANQIFTELTTGIDVGLDLPDVVLPTDFPLPPETGPAYEALPEITLDQLTTAQTDGTGVFDVLMRAVSGHLAEQHKLNRITGSDFAKVYLGSVTSVLQFGTQFLLERDQATLQNLQLQEQIKIAQVNRVKAGADLQVARGQIVQMAYENAKIKAEANTSANQYALSKMALVNSYDEGLINEANVLLTKEKVEVERAQTRDTHVDGTPIIGIMGKQKALLDAQVLTQTEELDTARASTKDTLLNGSAVGGLVAIDKAFKEAQQLEMENRSLLVLQQVQGARAQYSNTQTDGTTLISGILLAERQAKEAEAKLNDEQFIVAYAQTKDLLPSGGTVAGTIGIDRLIKLAQKSLTEEQVDTQRAQTKDTLVAGGPIVGIAAKEKFLKDAQGKYILEQYETQRGQTRGTLSTGENVAGILGTQKLLYEEQITSYKRDAESKTVKMLLDTWTARKTIDDGVAVPNQIDNGAIDTAVTAHRTNLGI